MEQASLPMRKEKRHATRTKVAKDPEVFPQESNLGSQDAPMPSDTASHPQYPGSVDQTKHVYARQETEIQSLAVSTPPRRGGRQNNHHLADDPKSEVVSPALHSIEQDPRLHAETRNAQLSASALTRLDLTSPNAPLEGLDRVPNVTEKDGKTVRAKSSADQKRLSTSSLKSGQSQVTGEFKPNPADLSKTKEHGRPEKTEEVKQPAPVTPWDLSSLQGASTNPESRPRGDSGGSDVSSWRRQLRKVPRFKGRPPNEPTTPPIIKLRQSLSKVVQVRQQDVSKNTPHNSKRSSSPVSPQPDGGPLQLDDFRPFSPSDYVTQGLRPQPSPSRRKLRQVEELLRKSAEDLSAEAKAGQAEQPINPRTDDCGIDSHTLPNKGIAPEAPKQQQTLPPNHECAWRMKCMHLRSEVEQLKSEQESRKGVDTGRSVGLVDAGVGNALAQHECADIDIEGLTIVMHLRGKDDVVINTNLR